MWGIRKGDLRSNKPHYSAYSAGKQTPAPFSPWLVSSTLETDFIRSRGELTPAAWPSNSLQGRWIQTAWREAASFIFPQTDKQPQSPRCRRYCIPAAIPPPAFPGGVGGESDALTVHTSLRADKQTSGTRTQSGLLGNRRGPHVTIIFFTSPRKQMLLFFSPPAPPIFLKHYSGRKSIQRIRLCARVSDFV